MGTTTETLPSQDLDDSLNDKRKPLSRKLKFLTVAAIFVGNVTFGCALNSYGPVATSMQNKYHTSSNDISKVFTIVGVSYMFGALSDSFMFRFINRQLAVIILLSIKAVTMFVTPFCSTLAMFFVTSGVFGFCCGSYDVAQVVWMIEMMQKDCPPYVQSQHFFYALGTVFPSLIMAPFLDDDEPISSNTTTTTTTTTETYFFDLNNNDILEVKEGRDKLFIPYTIIGSFLVCAAVFQALLFVFLRYREPPPETSDEASIATTQKDFNNENTTKKRFMIGQWPLRKLQMVVLACCFQAGNQGMETSAFNFFPKFGQSSELELSESESTYVLTGMNAAYAVGRAVAIPIVLKVPPRLILIVNLVLTLLANVLLVGWAKRSLPVLWASSVIFGLGFSSTMASFFAFIERYIVITDLIGSAMIVCGSVVGAIYPLVIGNSIDNNPIVLGYVEFFSLTVITLSLGTLSYMTYRNKTRY